jgi:hypothetical protein
MRKKQLNVERHVANPATVCWPIYAGAWRERAAGSPNGTVHDDLHFHVFKINFEQE